MKRLLFSRTVFVTTIVLVGMAANDAFQQRRGRDKLETGGFAMANGPSNVAVDLNVAPEQFHMSRLQQWGTMVGASARTVSLRSVTPANLAIISSQSWVAAIRRLDAL